MEHNKNKPFLMHIDLNSCFATVTQQAFPHLRSKPVVIAAYASPNGCVLSPSIEAKRFGIKTGCTVREAQLLCPGVVVRMADVIMVRDVHVKMRAIFRDYSPSVTPKSIDEVVIDFTGMEHIVDGKLEDLAKQIKHRLRTEVGEWISCSIGISTNRFLAKTAASLIKPDGLVTITHKNVRDVYQKLELIDLCGINTRYQARLNTHQIFTPMDFLNTPLEVLKNQVFQSIVGYYWYLRLRGHEIDAVDFKRKSFGQDYALQKHTKDPQELSRIMMKLCEKMGRRLRKHGLSASGIHVSLLYPDGTHWHRGRKTKNTMYTTPELFRETLYTFNSRPEVKTVSKLSVSCYGLTECDDSQSTLFDNLLQDSNSTLFGSYVPESMLSSGKSSLTFVSPERHRRLYEAVDKINDRYGEFVLTPVLMMGMEDVVLDRIAFGAIKELEDLYEVNDRSLF